ncbi:MAG TPA: DUF2318 domain-containing protein [Blastocatellia bacterium]|jgi:uncharacterized membrane protein|nr:DUF2318 domain-containing protein [Blastocatellia bacterium]
MQNQSQSGQSREKKRAEFSAPAQSKNRSVVTLVTLALLVAAGVVAYVVMRASTDAPAPAPVATSGGSGDRASDVRIPLAEVSDKAKFFDFKTADNSAVRFFAIRSSDGVYRVALNACDTCYHAKKGYHQEGDDMICNNCGLKFPSAKINEAHGGCNPISVPRAVEGDSLVIKASDLERGKQYF